MANIKVNIAGTKTGKRVRGDQYETPPEPTQDLVAALANLYPGMFARNTKILEPACGTGRMVRDLRDFSGANVTGTDIKTGKNFLKRTKPFPGAIVTNPPYKDGLAEAFIRHALHIADGPVALLLNNGVLWGQKRADTIYAERLLRPQYVLIIPYRIYFIKPNGKKIPSQAYQHAWLIWPERAARNGKKTTVYWPNDFAF